MIISQPDSEGKIFTEQGRAIAIIISFKPVFQRVPRGSVDKMTIQETPGGAVENTTQETLAFYVDNQVVGVQAGLSSGPLKPWKPMTIVRSGWITSSRW
jgi:hypothetical protein